MKYKIPIYRIKTDFNGSVKRNLHEWEIGPKSYVVVQHFSDGPGWGITYYTPGKTKRITIASTENKAVEIAKTFIKEKRR